MVLIGIDPGAGGALSFFRPDTNALQVMDMPTVTVKSGSKQVRRVDSVALAGILRPWSQAHSRESIHVIVEQVGAMPGQGVSSMFAFGRAAGVVEGVLAGLLLAHTFVPPAVWTRQVGVKGGKDAARLRVGQLFPAAADLIRRVKDDGRADAILLAYWGKHYGGCRVSQTAPPEVYKQPRTWEDSWTTGDELRFVFGGPFYRGLLRADMVKINKTRENVGLPPISRSQMLDQYTRNLYLRRWDPRVDHHEVGRAVTAKMLGADPRA